MSNYDSLTQQATNSLATSFGIDSFSNQTCDLQRELNQIQRRMIMRDIAVRGFTNDKFNTTFGKGLFRRALFNGSVELTNPNQKYLVDYLTFQDWQNTAKSDEQMAILHKLYNSGFTDTDEIFCSWVKHYEPISKTKTDVGGFSVYSIGTQELYISIDDAEHGTVEDWSLTVKNCDKLGVNKPVFLATNLNYIN